jgi:hypothetical protein
MEQQRKQLELCALCEKKDKNGNTFFAGHMGGNTVMVFKNTRKTKENQPDYRVVLVEREREAIPKQLKEDDDLPF